jgi:putative ATPase
MAQLGYHDGYLYPHDFPEHFVQQDYLPEALRGTRFYHPADNAGEERAKERMQRWWGSHKREQTGKE